MIEDLTQSVAESISAITKAVVIPAMQMQKRDIPDFYLNTTFDRAYVSQFADTLERSRNEDSRHLYFVTTTYLDPIDYPLTANRASKHFQSFHRCLLAHLCGTKRYNRPWFREIEPQVYAFLDAAGSKSKHRKLSGPSLHESRFHHHAVLCVHRDHSPKLEHLTEQTYANEFAAANKRIASLKSLNIQKIKDTRSDLFKVVEYASQYARRHFDDPNSLQVFPIASNEFHSRHIRRGTINEETNPN